MPTPSSCRSTSDSSGNSGAGKEDSWILGLLGMFGSYFNHMGACHGCDLTYTMGYWKRGSEYLLASAGLEGYATAELDEHQPGGGH